jgi:hypothetical protein
MPCLYGGVAPHFTTRTHTMAILHSIKAQLYDNVLTENPNDFIARVASEKSLNIKDICKAATTRGGSDISAAAMEHAVNLWLKHSVSFEFNQGSLLRKELAGVEVNILGVADASLFIAQATDIKTASINDLLTPNRNLRISGGKIKIDGDSDQNGVYFINTQTNERAKVDATDIVNNNPSE